jgi:uncharacterized membrane protein (DUF106 family)
MNFHNNKTHKPVKDQDLKTITYFLRVAGLSVPFLCLLGLYIGIVYWGLPGAVSGVVIAAIVGLILSVIVMFLMDAVSTLMSRTIENTMKITRTQAIKIQEVEKSVQTMTSELFRINNRLNKK